MNGDTPWVIKVGMLISYDYEYAFQSIPLLYPQADRLVLAVDKDRRTWSGGSFTLPGDFFDKIKKLDPDGKIEVLEGDFYVPGLSVMENDTRERNLLAEYLGPGGWHIQVDSDEYFVDFRGFCQYLHSLESSGKDWEVSAHWLTLLKQERDGWFFIDSDQECFPVATNAPRYEQARNNFSSDLERIQVPFWAIHQSWARTELEIEQKLRSWSHAKDFSTEAYFQFWKSISEQNFMYLKNIHPLTPHFWPALGYREGDLKSLLEYTAERAEAFRLRTEELRLQRKREKTNPRTILKLFVPPVLTLAVQGLRDWKNQISHNLQRARNRK